MTKQNEYFPQSVPHPGVDLTEKLEELRMDTIEFAIRTGIPEKIISGLIKGDNAITPKMAEQFEKVLQIPAQYWLNSQHSYSEYKARVSF